jgi:hypothetical protein
MPFGLKKATNTFTRTMSTVFKELGDRFLKIFVDDLNIHSKKLGKTSSTLGCYLFQT